VLEQPAVASFAEELLLDSVGVRASSACDHLEREVLPKARGPTKLGTEYATHAACPEDPGEGVSAKVDGEVRLDDVLKVQQ
jgi:hypothetical protein